MCVPPELASRIAQAREDAPTWGLAHRPKTGVPWSRELEREWQELRREWAREERRVPERERCWAMLRDGSQCGRRAADAGVCETHAYVGCRLPGLGWLGGVPQGRILVRSGTRRR